MRRPGPRKPRSGNSLSRPRELKQDLSARSQRLSVAAVTQSAGVGADLLKIREPRPSGYSSRRQSGAQFAPNLASA